MTETRLSPTLGDLARAFRDATARSADTMGRILVRARRVAKRGEWLPFLEAAGIRERAAQKLMRFVELTDEGRNPEGLSMRALLEAEATPKLSTGNPPDESGFSEDREALRERITALEAKRDALKEGLLLRERLPTCEARIEYGESVLAALRSTHRELVRDTAKLLRQKAALIERAACCQTKAGRSQRDLLS